MWFPCHSTTFLLVFVCRLQTMLALSFRRSSHRTSQNMSSNFLTYLIFLESRPRIIDLHYAADSMGLSLFIFFLVGSVKRTFSARVRISCSRSCKVIDFGANRKRVCDFLLVRYSIGPSLHRFRDIARFLLPAPILP